MVSLPSEGSRKDPEIYQRKYILGPPSWTLTEKTNYISDFGEIYRKKKKKGAKSWRLWQDQVHGVQNMSVLLVTFRDDKMTLGFTSLSVKLLAELQFVLLSYWQAAKWLLQLKMGWSCFSDWPVMDSCPFVISFIFWLLFIILIHHFFPVTLTERYTTK